MNLFKAIIFNSLFITFAIEMQKLYVRDNYQEVVTLTLIILGAFLKDLSSYTIGPTGSISHTRLIVNVLWEFKTVPFYIKAI